MLKIKNIHDFRKRLVNFVVLSSFIWVGIIAVVTFFIWTTFNQKKNFFQDQQIVSTNALYKSTLAGELSTIASSDTFVDYIRSGYETRSALNLSLLSELSAIHSKTLTGMVIYDRHKKALFKNGKRSPYHIDLNLCYLNTKLNAKYGSCDHSWRLFFKKSAYLKSLQKFNSSIHYCKQCKKFDVLSGLTFGGFPVANHSNMTIGLSLNQSKDELPFYLISALILVTFFALVLMHAVLLEKLINRFIYNPLSKLSETLNTQSSLDETSEEIEELQQLKYQIKNYQQKKNVIKMGEMAAQVAHDIRSPLSALQVLTEQKLPELEEPKRILLRDAVYQIRDIVNNLDESSFAKSTETQIAILLEHVLSERRAALNQKSISITSHFGADTYNLYIKVLPSDIKRVLTNLINNSVEAINSEKGKIDVLLNSDGKNAIITISDNGCGIPDHLLNSIFEKGFSTKESGSGLGLFHAHEIITQSHGSIAIDSKTNQGTTIRIQLPLAPTPSWFATKLIVPRDSIVVCVDDSVSIWNVWQERFRTIAGNLELRYCSDKASLLRELGKEDSKLKTYLVDYEFSGQTYTGFDLIEKIFEYKKPDDQVLLVTSRSGEEIQTFCIDNDIQIVSKFFALKIPIEIR